MNSPAQNDLFQLVILLPCHYELQKLFIIKRKIVTVDVIYYTPIIRNMNINITLNYISSSDDENRKLMYLLSITIGIKEGSRK